MIRWWLETDKNKISQLACVVSTAQQRSSCYCLFKYFLSILNRTHFREQNFFPVAISAYHTHREWHLLACLHWVLDRRFLHVGSSRCVGQKPRSKEFSARLHTSCICDENICVAIMHCNMLDRRMKLKSYRNLWFGQIRVTRLADRPSAEG